MAKVSPIKTPMREQPAAERVRNYDEVPYGYSPQEAILEAERCLMCKKQPCIDGCPVTVRIPDFLNAVAEIETALGPAELMAVLAEI